MVLGRTGRVFAGQRGQQRPDHRKSCRVAGQEEKRPSKTHQLRDGANDRGSHHLTAVGEERKPAGDGLALRFLAQPGDVGLRGEPAEVPRDTEQRLQEQKPPVTA